MSAEIVPLAGHPGGRRGDPASMAAVFRHRRLTVGQSSTVHALHWYSWIGDLVLPGPACRQGFAGHGTHAELLPTERAMTCRRCRRLRPELVAAGPAQTVLSDADGSAP